MAVIALRFRSTQASFLENTGFISEQVRDSGVAPTRGMIAGLLGAALGVKRGEKLPEVLAVATHFRKPPKKGSDFAIIQNALNFSGKLKGSHMITKYYLHDVDAVVLVEVPNKNYSQYIEALKNPVYPIYFGRKSCIPTLPLLAAKQEWQESSLGECLESRTSKNGVYLDSDSLPMPIKTQFEFRKEVFQCYTMLN